MNRLVVRFAWEGVAAVARWRGEVNVPRLTHVGPGLLLQVSAGTLGPGTHGTECGHYSVLPSQVEHKLGLYRHMAELRKAPAVNSRP